MYEMRDMTGSLFVNNRKEKDTHADYKGTIKIGGSEYWLSGWKKHSNGKDWISFAVQPKLPQSQTQEQYQQNTQGGF